MKKELFELIQREDDQTLEIFRLIMDGANLEWKNPEDEEKSVVHCAVIFDKLCYLEMIIQNGGSIFCLETRNWTPMVFPFYLPFPFPFPFPPFPFPFPFPSYAGSNINSSLPLLALCCLLPPSTLCCCVA